MDEDDQEPSEERESRPAIMVDLTRLQPLEIVLLCRYASESSTDSFPAIDACCDDVKQQLRELPNTDLQFARTVYRAFAMSPYPVDRLNIGINLRAMTLADHDTGYALWSQLVRDQHPVVRRDVYEQLQRHFEDEVHSPQLGLAEEGLSLDEAEQLRDGYIKAQYAASQFVIERTAVTEALEEATNSFHSFSLV